MGESFSSGAAYSKSLRLRPKDKSRNWGLGAAPEEQERQKDFLGGGWEWVEHGLHGGRSVKLGLAREVEFG